ncbi:MAG: preprotein translocase subunit SecE [bacterium]
MPLSKLTTKNIVNKINKKKYEQRSNESFFYETKKELKEVTWPTKDIVYRASLLIIGIVIVSTLYVMVADILFGNFFEMLRSIK